MNDQPKTQYQPGLSEAFLRRCGERPYSSFLILWGALFVLSLLVGLLGFSVERFDGKPPVPEAVPYHDYLPGGQYAELNGSITVPWFDLPLYDAKLAQRGVGFWVTSGESEAHENRLIAQSLRYAFGVGWPHSSLGFASFTAWDVTDPSRPFQSTAGQWMLGFLPGHYYSQFSWANSTGSRVWTVSNYLPGALMHVALPQLLAFAIVLSLWIRRQRRIRVSLQRGLCLNCGYQLDPTEIQNRCPECGQDREIAERVDKTRNLCTRLFGGTGRRAAVFFAAIALVWLSIQPLAVVEETRTPLPERIDSLAQASDDLNRSFIRSAGGSLFVYGWPVWTVQVQSDHWYSFSPGVEPSPAPAVLPRNSGGLAGVDWSFKHADPSVSTTVFFFWPLFVFQLAILHWLVTIVTLVVLSAYKVVCKVRQMIITSPAPA